ncbi:MAG TPA: hypothetical protein VFV72_12890 [Candidatus Limnocylindrales bacterium]|nr:hypothetical protein [Candidatus Limnocylindrales bacterium]
MSKRSAKPVKPLKPGRLHRLSRGRSVEVFEGPPVGDGVVVADFASVMAALDRFDPDMPWKKARDQVLPIMPRVRPMPGPELDLVRAMLPPGILVGFGIDLGPAITFITMELLGRWRVDPSGVATAALANLDAIARRCGPDDVLDDHIADTPVSIVQTGRGIAASLLLVPGRLEPVLGRAPRFLLAPMRDILIALPANVDREFAAWLATEWEALDPNHLHLGGFRYEAGRVTPEPIEQALARA